jgi:hypothetical protein
MKITTVGVDIAKNVIQLHWVDPDTGEIVSKPVKRAAFLEHFANRTACRIGMEACGGAQHWARRLIEMGHEVKLMPAKFVKAFNTGNKNDAADARAIWMATQMPTKAVAVKTEAQQAVLALHRMRQQLVKFRTMQINSLRGLLTEYGEVMAQGRAALDTTIPGILARLVERLPAILIDTLREQWNGLTALDCRNRTTPAGVDERGQGVQGNRCHTGRWPTDGDSCYCDYGRSELVQIRPRVCGVARPGAWANRLRGQNTVAWDQQAWRHLFENLADSRRSQRVVPHEGTYRMDRTDEEAPTTERGDGRACQQDGENHLGSTGARPTVREGPCQREAGLRTHSP